MVAIRRIKYVIKLAALSLFILTFVIYLQWDEISYRERVKRYVDGLKGQMQNYEDDLLESERDVEVDDVLKKIKEDVDFRLSLEDALPTWTLHYSSTADQDTHESTGTKGIITKATSPHIEQQPEHIANMKLVKPIATPAPDARQPTSRDQEKKAHARPITWIPYPWEPKMRGQLNVHVWQAWCGNTIHDLRRNWFFPSYPDFKFSVKRFFVQHFENDYGQRIFGYIHPPLTGKYIFALSSDDSSEFWLSTDEHPKNVKLLAWVGNRTNLDGNYKTHVAQFTKYQTQISKPIFLERGKKYFVEALHKQGIRDDHILVGWKIPGFSGFRFITGDSISMYLNDRFISSDVTEYAKYVPQNLPSHSHAHSSNIILDRFKHKFGSGDSDDYSHMDFVINPADVRGVLPACNYSPSYLVDFRLSRYDGVKLIHDSAVYPDDNSELTHMKPYDQCIARRLKDSHGNKLKYRIPKFTNDSIYEDGQVRVLSHDDGVAVVASPEDWEKEFLKYHAPSSDGVKSVDQNQSSLEKIFTEVHEKLAGRKQRPSKAEGSRKEESRSHPRVNAKHSNEPQRPQSQQVKRQGAISKTKARPNMGRVKTVKRKSNVRGRSSVTSASKIIRKRKGRNPSKVQRVSSRRVKTKANVGVKKKVVYSRGKGKRINKRIQAGGDTGYPGRTPLKSDKRSSNTMNNEQKDTARHGRKLLSVASDQKRLKSYFQATRDYLLRQRGRAVLPQYNIRPAAAATAAYNRIQYGGYAYDDAVFTRVLMARDYIRRLARIVQHYRYSMSSRQVSTQIYRRFGVNITAPALFPVLDYDPWLYNHNTTKCGSDGNLQLNPVVAQSIVNRYMDALNLKTNNKYSLRQIINVEENHDVIKGDRYLLELDLHVHGQRSHVRLSQYIYQKIGESTLCQPHLFRIHEHATVHVIVPVKNQGRWVQYFIDDMSELYTRTQDPHLNVIIVDFASDDIDIKAALRRSALKRYQLIKLRGAFQRAYGIQAGSSYVKNPHDIIFMCDLHLELPNNMINIIRKHTIEGRMAFAPIVTRLHCGFTPYIPFGFWELQGYGLFAMYKSDFRRVGGMNYREFGTRWGGEDWELLDRVLVNKMEVERLRIPNFYHFYHSKKGMWGTPTLDVASSDVPEYYSSDKQIIPQYDEVVDTTDSVEIHITVDTDDTMDTVIGKNTRPARVRKASRIMNGQSRGQGRERSKINGGNMIRRRTDGQESRTGHARMRPPVQQT